MLSVRKPGSMGALSAMFRRNGERIGFVPTMGFLHEGHLSLVRRARELADRVVVSIYVNPTQFGPSEDYEQYPRDLDRDMALCRREGVHVVFHPAAADMVHEAQSVSVEESALSAGLCGATRPGHFRGVATVVAQLFHIVRPDIAVFGRKDAQQARVIQRMGADLCFPVRVVVAPIAREADGLAMSSRNAYLAGDERKQAACLCRALRLAERLYAEGETCTGRIREEVWHMLEAQPAANVEYVETVDVVHLNAVDQITGPTLLALCVRFGDTRLIDNTVLGGVFPSEG